MTDYDQCVVLVVDDTKANIDFLLEGLASEPYQLAVTISGEAALEFAKNSVPDLILMDVMMPGISGYEVCRHLKEDPKTTDIPVIFLTALDKVENKSEGFRHGGVDYVTKPFEIIEVRARVRAHLELSMSRRTLAQQKTQLEEIVEERTQELVMTQDVTIRCLASLAETRDNETGGHIRRTQSYVKLLTEVLSNNEHFSDQLDAQTCNNIFKSAPLHDIGKVGVPDSILLKPGKLTDEEFDEMRRHTIYGRDTIAIAENELGISSFLGMAKEIAYTHHEKWNGRGYPQGLKEEEIPLSGRLMAVADVYDALISERVYKPCFPHSKAVAIILSEKGEHFDPLIVDAFEAVHEQFRDIAISFADSDSQKEVLKQ